MSSTEQARDKIVRILRHAGKPMRTRDLLGAGVHPRDLYTLRDAGTIRAVMRGMYELSERENQTQHTSLATVAARVPHGVVCLLSALQFHELTTQWPHEVWLAVERGSRRPALDYPPLHVVVVSDPAFSAGIEEHSIEGTNVRVYDLAKTVVDCFKFRNQIGFDVALEALRESWRARRVTMDQLWHYAGVCRQRNTMRPYLESLT